MIRYDWLGMLLCWEYENHTLKVKSACETYNWLNDYSRILVQIYVYEPLQERISKELLEHSESSMIDTRAKLMAQNQDKESKQR